MPSIAPDDARSFLRLDALAQQVVSRAGREPVPSQGSIGERRQELFRELFSKGGVDERRHLRAMAGYERAIVHVRHVA